MTRCILLSALLLFFCSLSPVFADDGLDARQEARVDSLLKSATHLINAGDMQAAQKVLSEEQRVSDSLNARYHAEGEKLFARGDLDHAREWFLKAVDKDAQDTTAYFRLGEVAYQKKDYPSAIHYLSEYLHLNPNSMGARTMLKFSVQKSLHLPTTTDTTAYFRLGEIAYQKGDYPNAIHYLSEYLHLNPNSMDARTMLKFSVQKSRDLPTTTDLKNYTFPCQVIPFQEADSLRIEIAYALPKAGLSKAGGIGAVYLDEHIFCVDIATGDTLSFFRPFSHLPEVDHKPPRNTYYLVTDQVNIPLGHHYRLEIEVRDRHANSLGIYQTECTAPAMPAELGLSDFLLARRIEARVPFPETRKDLVITPNPLRLYQQGEPIYIYLEIYHLLPEASGQTSFELSYEIGWPQKEEIDPRLFEAFDRDLPKELLPDLATIQYLIPYRQRRVIDVEDLPSVNHKTRVAIPYTGSDSNDRTYLQIETNNLSPGVYKITIQARDLIAKETAVRTAFFRIE